MAISGDDSETQYEDMPPYLQDEVNSLTEELLPQFKGDVAEARSAAIASVEAEAHHDDLPEVAQEKEFTADMAESERRFIDGDDMEAGYEGFTL
jgi:hypothetical protein